MRYRLAALLVMTGLAASPMLRAQGRTEAPSCAVRSTALARISCELARGLPKSDTRLLIVATRSAVGAEAESTNELVHTLSRLVAAELGNGASLHAERLDAARASHLARANLDVVAVSGELNHQRFAASADLVRAPQGFWRRFRGGELAVTAHAYASSVLDAELRAALPTVPLVITRVDKAAALDEPSLALACGDLDGDGSLEVVSVGRRRIQAGRIDHGKFRVEKSTSWAELSEVAPRPLREPIAVASIPSPGRLEIGISDRADGARLDGNLKLIERLSGQLPWPGGGCTRVSPTGVSSTRSACSARAVQQKGDAVDAIAGLELATRQGTLGFFARRSQDGKLDFEWGTQHLVLPAPVGAQLALGELNGDGRPELITSLDTLDAATDAVVVHTLSDAGDFDEAFRLPVPSGVRALAVCPSEGPALAPVVIATSDGLWILR
jgi:hypothetical protein